MTPNILPSRRFRLSVWVSGIVVCFLIASAGVAVAAMRYDAKNSDVVLEGISVGGVDIGGLSFADAKERLSARFVEPLDRPLSLDVGDEEFTTTPLELKVSSDALDKLNEATSVNGAMPVVQRIWYRLTGTAVGKSLPVSLHYDDDRLKEFVDELAASVDRSPKDAQISLVEGGIRISDEVRGFELDRKKAIESLKEAISSDEIKLSLEGKSTEAAIEKADIKDVIVVKVGENKLLHYRGEEIVKVYDVATGTSEFPTPKGNFKIINKRFKPTWVNPAKFPGGWGYNLPERIGPGPGNPLGTRALDLNSPGIRIHGTYAAYSIGYAASHGCIRMRIADVEELFGLVGVGTPVIITQSGPYKPMPARLKPTTPQPEAEDDGTQVAGQQASPTPSPSASP